MLLARKQSLGEVRLSHRDGRHGHFRHAARLQTERPQIGREAWQGRAFDMVPLARKPFDIRQAAEELIADYGDEAETIAAGQADTMLELGDMEACDAWKEVVAAIRARRDSGFEAAG
jgi:hypothetical protein